MIALFILIVSDPISERRFIMSEEKRKKDNQLKDEELKDEELDEVSGGTSRVIFEECKKCGKLILTPTCGSWTCPACGTSYMRIMNNFVEDW